MGFVCPFGSPAPDSAHFSLLLLSGLVRRRTSASNLKILPDHRELIEDFALGANNTTLDITPYLCVCVGPTDRLRRCLAEQSRQLLNHS